MSHYAPEGSRTLLLPVTDQRRSRPSPTHDPRPDGPDLDERVATLWRTARLGPGAEQLRRLVLTGPDRRIDPGQFRALDTIAAHGSCTMRDLAAALNIDPSTATRTVKRLGDAGLVAKVRSDRDHRSILVELTEDGWETHQYFAKRAFAIYEEIFAVFDDDEKRVLAGYLERMLAATHEALDKLDDPSSERFLDEEIQP